MLLWSFLVDYMLLDERAQAMQCSISPLETRTHRTVMLMQVNSESDSASRHRLLNSRHPHQAWFGHGCQSRTRSVRRAGEVGCLAHRCA